MSSNYADKLKHPVFKVVSQYATEHDLDAYVIGGFGFLALVVLLIITLMINVDR